MLNQTPWQAQADSVFLLADFPSSLRPIYEAELHLFAYLACLISVFENQPSADWGYGFIVTPDGFPYAAAQNEAISLFEKRGVLNRGHNGRLEIISDAFQFELDVHQSLSQSRKRRIWTKTAAQCALMIPRGHINQAVSRSPGVYQNSKHSGGSALLMSGESARLLEEWDQINEVLGPDVEDRLAPSVVWLSVYVKMGSVDALQS